MDLFSANGGTNIGAMVEAAKNTMGEQKVSELMNKFGIKSEAVKTAPKVMKVEDVSDESGKTS